MKRIDANFNADGRPCDLRDYKDEIEPDEDISGENKIGVEMPKYLKKDAGVKLANWLLNLNYFLIAKSFEMNLIL